MNAESNTPSSPSPNNHPALALVSRIDILDTKLHLLELYVTEAQAAAAAESKKLREQFQAELNALQAEVKQKESTLETHQALAQQADRNQRKHIQELRAELLEANRLAESRQSELTANKLAATALRDRINFLETDAEKNRAESTRQMASLLEHIKQLESANQQVENRIATELQAKFEQELTALRQTLEERDAELQLRETSDRDAAARHASEIQALQNDIAATQQLLKENDRALGAATAENRRLQDRIAAVNAVHEQAMADAQRSFEARSQEYRQQITVLERRNESNTRRLREHGDELTRLQTQHMMLQRAADEQQHQTAAAQAEIVKLESQQQGLKTELAEARQRQQEQEDLSHELRRLGEQLAEKQGIIDSGVREFAALENQANQLRAQVAQLEEAKWLAGEEHGATLGRLNEQLDHLQTQLAAKEQNIAGREQECAALQQQLRQLREHLAHQEHRQNQREEEHGAAVAALQQELRQVGEQLIATRQSAEARGDEVNELHGRVRQLNDQIAALEHDRHQVADGHRSHIHSLEDQLWEVGKQLGEKQQQLEGREGEIYSLQDEVRALLQQISQLQQAREQAVNEHQAALGLVRDQLEAQLGEKRHQIEAREREVNELQNTVRELHQQVADLHQVREQVASEYDAAVDAWRDRQHNLEAQLGDKQQVLELREREVANLEATARQLSERLLEQEKAQQQAAAEQGDRIHQLEASIAARAQEFAAALAEHSTIAAESSAELETLRAQTHGLNERTSQLQSLLQQSDSEKHELDERRAALQQQLHDLQHAFEEAQAALQGQQAEFSALRDRLEVERHAVAQRATDWEQRFGAQEADLRRADEENAALHGELQTREALHQERLLDLTQNLESTRRQFDAELAALRDELQLKEAALQDRRAELAASETRLNGKVQELTAELTHEQHRCRDSEQELAQASAEVEILRTRVAELETLSTETEHGLAAKMEQLTRAHGAELADVRAQLQEREQAQIARELHWHANQERARAEFAALRQEHSEQQGLIAQREQTIAELQREADKLTDQLYEAEASYHQKLNASLTETEQRFTTELALRQVAILQLQNELADNQRHAIELEESLTSQVHALQQRLADNETVLGQRGAALADVNSEISRLRDRLGALQGTNEELVNEGRESDERFRLRLADLENALAEGTALAEQRSAELEQAQAEISALRQHILIAEELYRQSQIEDRSVRAAMQEDLSRARQALDQKAQDFVAESTLLYAAREQVAEELRAVQTRLAEREALLDAREHDCAALRAEIRTLTAQLFETETAQQSAEATNAAMAQAQRQAATLLAEKEALLSESLAVQQAQEIELGGLREQAVRLEGLQFAKLHAEENFKRAERVSSELAALRVDLAEKERGLALHEEGRQERERSHQESLNQLQIQLTQQQLLAESRARQTEDLRSHIEVLQEQLSVLESNSIEFARRQQEEFSKAETVLRSDIDGLLKEIAEQRDVIEARTGEIDLLQSGKAALQNEIERLAAAGMRLSSVNADGNPATYGDQLIEIANLRAEIIEKQQLLEDRNERLLHAKGELADLQKSMENITAPRDEAHPVIAATDNELLWEQLGRNDRVAEDSEAAVVNERETGFRVTFDRRQNDTLAIQPGAPTRAERQGDASASAAVGDEHEGLEFLVRHGKGDGRPLPKNGHDRRWRFSLRRKRRWKS